MTAKNRDSHNRWRNITVGFRVSPEENEMLNQAVALSGLAKQEYCYRRCMQQDIVVQGNPKIYKALKTTMTEILTELRRISAGNEISPEMLAIIQLITVTLKGLKEERTMNHNAKLCRKNSPKRNYLSRSRIMISLLMLLRKRDTLSWQARHFASKCPILLKGIPPNTPGKERINWQQGIKPLLCD